MNYYSILGVSENATQQEIKSAYRNMINAFHPDHYRGPNKKFAEQKTKELIEAYEVLKDPETRAAYDRELKYKSSSWYDDSCAKSEKKQESKEEKPKEEPKQENAADYNKTDNAEDGDQKSESNNCNNSKETSKSDSKEYNQKHSYIKFFIIALVIVVCIYAAIIAVTNSMKTEEPVSSEAASILSGSWNFDHVEGWDSDGNEVGSDLSDSYIESNIFFDEDGSVYIHLLDDNYIGKWDTEEDGRIIISDIYPEDDNIDAVIDTIACYKDDGGYFIGWGFTYEGITHLFVYVK